jgi:hypothetical protein
LSRVSFGIVKGEGNWLVKAVARISNEEERKCDKSGSFTDLKGEKGEK